MDNPSAFPNSYLGELQRGMSLRDYFAGQALIGRLSNCDFDSASIFAGKIAEHCYQFADAMLKERANEPKQ